MNNINSKYDVIIIGAGISGLVCGCYLAKTSRKVLIIEQNKSPGGCCASFTRRGFVFDTGIHYLGSLRNGAQLNRVFNDLSIFNTVKVIRSKVPNVVKIIDNEFYFSVDINETIDNISRHFPAESKKIKNFFDYIANTSIIQLYSELNKLTWMDLLNKYFNCLKLKDLFSIFAYNLGLSANYISAVALAVLYRESILDGGYYLKGGLQTLPNIYAKRFQEMGGQLLLSNKVNSILFNSKRVTGVQLENSDIINSKYIVASCDLKEVYRDLFNKKKNTHCLTNKVASMMPSVSAFIVFLGLNRKIGSLFKNCGSFWYFPEKDIQRTLSNAYCNRIDENGEHFILASPSFRDFDLAPSQRESVFITVLVPFKTKEYWYKNRLNFEKQVLSRVKKVIPDIEKMIEVKENACPITIYNYTLNQKGAICGWASTPQQLVTRVPQRAVNIGNLFFSGHWTSSLAGYGGLAHVTYSGWNAANLIIGTDKQEGGK